ncbi:MAG: SpoIIE family protein phosphatase [Bacteroidales bacterium]|jgi:ligand-binding sensor domain-containing protein/serine phosphatase RsbU (regulator of sigma subunit)|nr:SpoIIE family protein phosphatase [Bacteroidales bacterium]
MQGRRGFCGTFSVYSLAWLLLFLVAAPRDTAGQNYYFQHLSSKEGLSASKIYTIIQDANDFIWLGTGSGVTRFDGLRFENFSTSDGLAPGGVKSILEDSYGRIWMGHIGGGMSLFEDDVFKKVSFSSVLFSGPDSVRVADTEGPVYNLRGDVTGIKEFDSYLWIATSLGGALKLDQPEPGVTIMTGRQYLGRDGLSNDAFGFHTDSDGNLYCITDVGIRKYNYNTDRFDPYSPEGLTKYFLTITMFEDSKGNMWFGTYNGGLYKLDRESGRMDIYDTRNGLWGNFVTYVTEDYRGNIWASSMEDWESRGGLTVFSPEGAIVFNSSNGLNSLHPLCMLEDKEKNILVADRDAGLFIYKGDHLTSYNAPQFLQSNDVSSIAQDQTGRYWFGTREGLSIYDPEENEGGSTDLAGLPASLQGKQINIIKPDNDGDVWIVTAEDEVFWYDLKKKSCRFDLDLNAKLHSLRIAAIETDGHGNLWIGTHKALLSWNATTRESNTYTEGHGLTGNNITSLFTDSNGFLWVGTEERNGLTKLHPGRSIFTPVEFGSDVRPNAIAETPDGTIWVGTIDGLYGLRADTVWKRLTETDGLLMNSINLLQSDGAGNLYIGTNLGLNRYDTSTGKISSFTEKNGFTGIETRPNASFADSKGDLWFGTSNGAIRMSPSRLPPVVTEPATHIWRTLVNLEPYPMYDGIRLPHSMNRIAFDFLSICLVNPAAVKYQFMLVGNDEDWISTDQTSAMYSSISPGKYTFMVRASNNYGYWNENPVTLSFTIRSPFYQTSWFILLSILAVISAIYGYINLRERNLLREKEVLEEKVEERTAEVVTKSIELEEKNRDITASIRYAERIQRAMLPPENYFNQTFVLFMPKDIVSGDFYWMYDSGDKQYIAVVDCTGHGVPGAFMSIIGHNSLNKVVKENGIRRPSEILDHLNIEVVHALLQRSEKAVRDGMDISIVCYDPREHYIEYAGAYQSLYHVRDGNMTIFKADRFPIGMIDGQEKKKFTNHRLEVRRGDMLYLFTDGYADQFGGQDEKKFKTINIRRLLSDIYRHPEDDQKRLLERAIRNWMGKIPQIDDILFVGTRVP